MCITQVGNVRIKFVYFPHVTHQNKHMNYLDQDVRMYTHAEVKAIVALERAEAAYHAKREFYDTILEAVKAESK